MNAPWSPTRVHRVALKDRAGLARVEAALAARGDATPFHDPRWLHGIRDGLGHASLYLVAEGQGGALVGLVPLTAVRSRLFGSALVSSGFGVGGGVLADTPATAAQLAEAAIAYAEAEGLPSIELRGGEDPGDWIVDDTTYVGFARDLAADDEAELKAIPRKQRAEVRRAQGFALDVQVGRDAATHYAVYSESVRNLGTPVFPRSLFTAMLDAWEPDADVLTVRREGRALASVLSVHHRGTVYPYWGGGTADARTWRANDAMYFALMSHARARGATRFDFGRSKTGTGPAAFKKNWGFEPQPLVYWRKQLRGPARSVNPNDPRYARKVELWKRLPLPLANLLGPPIARGLG